MEQPNFAVRRRQPFISESYFEYFSKRYPEYIEVWSTDVPNINASEQEKRALAAADVANYTFGLFCLRYTGGAPLDELRNDLPGVVEAYERYTKYLREHKEDAEYPPFKFRDLGDYERAMQLIGLCYLLGRRDLLPRLAQMLDGAYLGQDTLYEDLFAFELKDRYDVDEWYHESYRDLINSMYCDSEEESIADIKTYLDAWYPAMEGTPWHDTHLTMTEQGGAYFGYWAFEAGAIVYLLGLDDTRFRDHIVYPKDLVDYARQHFPLDQEQHPAQYRVLPGEPCPKTGEWMVGHTPRTARRFNKGEIMPELNLDTGATIWMFVRD